MLRSKKTGIAIKNEVLWENSNTTTPFFPQTIPIKNNKYSYYSVFFKNSNGEGLCTNITKKINNSNLNLTEYINTSGKGDGIKTSIRYIRDITNTGMRFTACNVINTYAGSNEFAQDNNQCVPIMITGFN